MTAAAPDSGATFAAESGSSGPAAEERAAEQQARAEIEQQEQGRAA
ncbi:hypothetical protein [Streptomyces sp. H27-C3]|nr:hypothetical protein [Streptomyces sp. H27-C3]MDJ0466436.1 hypothetical protein [Streptomyces sp. H27-C3]